MSMPTTAQQHCRRCAATHPCVYTGARLLLRSLPQRVRLLHHVHVVRLRVRGPDDAALAVRRAAAVQPALGFGLSLAKG
jgi:hypothetical protein